MRLQAPEHRFCATPDCPVVYFGRDEVFERQHVTVPVFQKEPRGDRLVCYCFSVGEAEILRERTATTQRITDLVKEGRCACEVRNPQGSCCLGNVGEIMKGGP